MTMGYEFPMRATTNELFSTLTDPTRREISERLCRDGEQTAGPDGPGRSLATGSLQAPRCPEACRLGARPARGSSDPLQAQPQGLVPLIDWMSLYGAFWRERFDRLEALLSRMDQ
jgi:hypothetical protein